jgi:uncharacterized protein
MIVDAHAHLGPWSRFAVADRSLEAYLSVMDHLGIEKAVISHHAGLVGLLEMAAELSEQAYEQSHGRILSYLIFDPNHSDKSLRLIEQAGPKPHFAGIKLHPPKHNCPADDDRYRPAWELAVQLRAVILAHTWDRSPEHPAQDHSFPDLFERYLAEFPAARFIFGHAGGRWNGFKACLELVKKYPNACLDITGDGYMLGRLEHFVREVGSERILYGSDAPWLDPRIPLGEVLGADIDEVDRENILGGNAARLFELGDGLG